MNNKKTYKIGLLLLVVSLISTVMLSGTFAKYTSEYVGSDTALVAKWELNMGSNIENGIIGVDQVMNLFSHSYDANIAGIDKIIAPGVEGSFNLKVTNNSDVAAAINFEITEPDESTNAAVPMEFSSNNGTSYGSLDVLNAYLNNTVAPVYTVSDASDTSNNSKSKEILWRWAFEVGDDRNSTDTALGIASAATDSGHTSYKLIVTATATQVEPTTTP